MALWNTFSFFVTWAYRNCRWENAVPLSCLFFLSIYFISVCKYNTRRVAAWSDLYSTLFGRLPLWNDAAYLCCEDQQVDIDIPNVIFLEYSLRTFHSEKSTSVSISLKVYKKVFAWIFIICFKNISVKEPDRRIYRYNNIIGVGHIIWINPFKQEFV